MPSLHLSLSPPTKPWVALRRALAFFGPGCLVAVGYMDPGNWATSIAGGSAYGHELLSVILLSTLMAMGFQAAAVRLGIAGDMDLAQACRAHFPPWVAFALWVLAEAAIVACNLAEVIGMAIGLNLVFGIPLLLGVALTILDVAVILGLQRYGFRVLEATIAGLVAMIAVSFLMQIYWISPAAADLAQGFLPKSQILSDSAMLYLAVGIVGATVMPHNLYLHSALVRSRSKEIKAIGARSAIRWATLDSTLALTLAFLVNAAILVVAVGAFHGNGHTAVEDLGEAYKLLSPALGVGVASLLFGLALIASGLSASVTGTMAGQIVMEGFLNLRWNPTARRLVTRALAIGPALIAVAWGGAEGANALLIFSQVVLSLQLSFAVAPLLLFTTRRKYLGDHAFGPKASIALWLLAGLVAALNLWLLQRMLFA